MPLAEQTTANVSKGIRFWLDHTWSLLKYVPEGNKRGLYAISLCEEDLHQFPEYLDLGWLLVVLDFVIVLTVEK